MDGSAMLEARDLTVPAPGAAGSIALDGVSVLVHPGEVVAVVGPHGAGKSALFRAIAGLLPVRSGTVRLNGRDVTALPARRRAALGIIHIPHPARIFEGLSVRDNLLVGAWPRRDRAGVARDLARVLDRFTALKKHLRRKAGVLSDGERALVALGRALMADPKVLLLDEPTFTSRAEEEWIQILGALGEASAEGLAMLVSEHDLATVGRLAVRVYALRSGRLVFTGSPAALATSALFAETYE